MCPAQPHRAFLRDVDTEVFHLDDAVILRIVHLCFEVDMTGRVVVKYAHRRHACAACTQLPVKPETLTRFSVPHRGELVFV
jgi:hypothetical protein